MASTPAALDCADVADLLGLRRQPDCMPDSCCNSCHDDADEGYFDLLEVEVHDKTAEVCCAISRAVDGETIE